MHTVGVLLAAGKSQRFEGIKQLAKINGIPMLCHVLAQYREGNAWVNGIDEMTVVLGANRELVQSILPNDVGQHFAPNWTDGMGSSLADAMRKLSPKVSHVLIGLGDQVAIDQHCIHSLLIESQLQPDLIIAAKYGQTLGAPAIFPQRFFAQLVSLSGDRGAREIIREHYKECVTVPMSAASLDIDYSSQLTEFVKNQYKPS
jgi:molybdenum cofactor cytidylyltransferase